MKFMRYDLGQLDAGATVVIGLRGPGANIMLLEGSNFASYREGAAFDYVGGHYEQSPVSLRTTHPGHWHAVVDRGDLGGRVESSIIGVYQAAA